MAASAKTQRKSSKHGRAHKTNYDDIYRYWIDPVSLGTLEYRTWLLRPKLPRLAIDGIVQTIELRDEPGNPVMVGDIVLHRPDPLLQPVHVYEGNRIRLEVLWFGAWREWTTMRLRNEKNQLAGEWTFELADDGVMLQEFEDIWHFTKSKKGGHPHGWKAHEIVREVCRRLGIEAGQVAEGKEWITALTGQMTAMQVLQRAYAIERRATGRRFVIRWHQGKLNILPMKRNPVMSTFGPLIEDALIGREDRDDKFATAVTVRATKKTGHGKHKTSEHIVVKLANPTAVKTEGLVHLVLTGNDVRSEAEARKKAQRYLNHHSVRKRQISGIQHRLVPFIRRGDAHRISLSKYGFYGQHGVVFVSSMTARLEQGQGTLTLDVTADDPYLAAVREAKNAAARKKKAAARKHAKMHKRK